MPELIHATPVGTTEHGDYHAPDRRNRAVEGQTAEKELDNFITRRAETTKQARTRLANEEEERYKATERQRTAEYQEAEGYQRVTWYRHLRRVYATRLAEVEATLSELGDTA